MIAAERETVVTMTDADDVVRIWTCRRRDITAMSKKPAFCRVDGGTYEDGTEWAVFTISDRGFDVARGARGTRTLTEAQRAANADRLRRNVGGLALYDNARPADDEADVSGPSAPATAASALTPPSTTITDPED